jgi:SSS family solute:Na+ symporter
MDLEFLAPYGFAVLNGDGLYEIPFLDRMGFVFIFCVLGMSIITNYENRKGVIPNGLEVDTKMFRMSPGFAAGSILVLGILVALYTIFW